MGKKILIIDDDPDFIMTTGMVLKSAGYEVIEALSGKEGLEKSKQEDPDLYIVDLMMETYSEGAKLAEALSEDEKTADKPKIMITSVDIKGPWSSYGQDQKISFDHVLQKPVSPDSLLKYVKKVLK